MKRTGSGILIAAALIGVAVGFLLDQLLTSARQPTFTPTLTLPFFAAALGVIVVALAIPIRRATHGTARAPINPFWALRVAVLAKASSIIGALFGGFGVGLAVFLLSRPVPPSVGSLGPIIATAVCGALLVVAGLVAEHLCTIRKDDDDPQLGTDEPEPDPHHH